VKKIWRLGVEIHSAELELGSVSGFVVTSILDHIPFAVAAGASDLVFGGRGHELSDGDVVVLGLGGSDLGFGA